MDFKRYKKKKRLILIVSIILIVALIIKIYVDTNVFKVNSVQFQTNKLPANSEITVLQISDLHNKVFGQNNEKLINSVEEVNADIIVLTGDLIDRDTDDLSDVFSLVEELTTINQKVFFVTGNHEWGNAYTDELIEGLRDRHVTVLDNKNTSIILDKVTINLVGIDDASTNHEDLDLVFDQVDEERYTILLSHSPGIVEKYTDISADLILSGHTHGGQVRVPLIGAIVAPDQGFFPELEKGTYEIATNQFLYIDSGVGTSVAPIRFLNQSQISLITITGEQ